MMGVCLHAPPPTSQKLGPIVNQTLSSFPQGFNTDTRPKLPLFLNPVLNKKASKPCHVQRQIPI